jgi:DtxR family Mn-dependent transcriptional regulator
MTGITNVVSKRERDCLVLLKEQSSDDFPLRLHEIASTMKIKPPTALNIIRRLKSKGYVETQDGMIKLSDSGDRISSTILMVHRTFESLFCQSGVSESKACREASEIDFLINSDNAMKVLKRIDSPSLCPHGKPIKV